MFHGIFWILFPQNDCSTADLQIVGAEDLSFLAGKVKVSCQNQEHLRHARVNSLLPESNSCTLSWGPADAFICFFLLNTNCVQIFLTNKHTHLRHPSILEAVI